MCGLALFLSGGRVFGVPEFFYYNRLHYCLRIALRTMQLLKKETGEDHSRLFRKHAIHTRPSPYGEQLPALPV